MQNYLFSYDQGYHSHYSTNGNNIYPLHTHSSKSKNFHRNFLTFSHRALFDEVPKSLEEQEEEDEEEEESLEHTVYGTTV